MITRLAITLVLFTAHYLSAQPDRNVTLDIDPNSVKPGFTAFQFDLVVTNRSDSAVTMLAPEWYLVDARWKRSPTTALGILSSPYVVHVKSAGTCIDTSFVVSVEIPYTLIPQSAVITIQPQETKKIGQIYINDRESCYKRDRAHGLQVFVTYKPVLQQDVFNTAEEKKVKEISDRLWTVYQTMAKLNLDEKWGLRNELSKEYSQYVEYETKVIGKITDLTLSTKTVNISQ